MTFNEMKEVYGDAAPSYDVDKHWHHQFKYGRTMVETALRRTHSAIYADTIHKVEAAILEDNRITIRQTAQEVKISVESVKQIFHYYLHMRNLSTRWIPRILTPFQRQERVNCSQVLLAMRRKKKNGEDFWQIYDTE
ncbi:protein GVQW3-like [Octopus sinensis]|uniref:Protein GVQW3-like n=1 Tax=Octopus sinensis TaxID=2607531 RepID=A0A6P7SAD5_9MOLL|nr:protein GVQW3-like [Octopus sinensis]